MKPPVKARKVRVMIVDDSQVITQFLRHLFTQDSRLEVVGVAHDVVEARNMLVTLKPDVLTLDLEMPKMHGVNFLKKIMAHFPTRTIIITGRATRNSPLGVEALNAGALDLIQKPTQDFEQFVKNRGWELCERIYNIASVPAEHLKAPTPPRPPLQPRRAQKFVLGAASPVKVVAIASSTGGTHALELFFSAIASPNLAFVVVQHMPSGFTRSLAERLDDVSPYHVVEAKEGEELLAGKVIIAPGDFHMQVVGTGSQLHRFRVALSQGPLLHGVRPAADYLMHSVAAHVTFPLAGIVFTGMGRDGGEGLLQLKKAGALTLAQSEDSCVVYGMPKYACEIKAVQYQGDVAQIARHLERWAFSPKK